MASALAALDTLLADAGAGTLAPREPSASCGSAPSPNTNALPRAAPAEKSDGKKKGGGGGGGAQPAEAAPVAPAAPSAAPEDPAAAAELARKLELVLSVGEECQTVDDLKNLLQKKPGFVCYDGFEPSGRMHIAQGLFKAINVNKLTSVGGTFVFWVADWFALMNDKMGGDLHKIQTVGKYLIEVWKAAGMDMSRVKFLWCADEISSKAATYWPKMLDIARCFDLDRIKKCCMIMARAENKLSGAQILYPLMQCTDIFFLKADVCQLGVDQRKVNMLARDYCGKVGIKLKPVILSHHMLFGLKAGQQKMSKSDGDAPHVPALHPGALPLPLPLPLPRAAACGLRQVLPPALLRPLALLLAQPTLRSSWRTARLTSSARSCRRTARVCRLRRCPLRVRLAAPRLPARRRTRCTWSRTRCRTRASITSATSCSRGPAHGSPSRAARATRMRRR